MYETGVFVAFLIWIYNTIMLIVNANSLLARNLSKVDMRLSWSTGQPVPAGDRAGVGWRVISAAMLAVVGLVGILLSWVSVAWSAGALIYKRSKSSGMPAAVKELRWKLRNVDMSREQIEAAFETAQAAIVPTTKAVSTGTG